MANDTYYILEDVKDLLGEVGDTNNSKATKYGLMADNKINISLTNIRDPDSGELVLPFTNIPSTIHDVANELTVGYFYKFESGSTDILEQALLDLQDYIDNKYRRIRFLAAGDVN